MDRFLTRFFQVHRLALNLVRLQPLGVILFLGFIDRIPTEDLVIAGREASRGEFAILIGGCEFVLLDYAAMRRVWYEHDGGAGCGEQIGVENNATELSHARAHRELEGQFGAMLNGEASIGDGCAAVAGGFQEKVRYGTVQTHDRSVRALGHVLKLECSILL
jgi:hypothetical protein